METKTITTERKSIPLTTSSKDWYYTINEHDTVVEDKVMTGKCTITGICRESVNIGDSFSILRGASQKVNYVVESITRRDSKGIFNNPEDAKDAFFTAECSFERLINA